MTNDEEDRLIGQTLTRLTAKFPSVSAEAVAGAVESAHAHFAGHRIRDFVPLLVERMAKEKLSSLVTS
ncbi:hypothetical protein ATN38_01750 [Rhodococcus sp. FH8]|jgi:hypothetical protein|uniref:Three-helix bundle dimerization domain-containing protein n=1 Tax=Rhodococcus baikonurensis TaxID=172041 RepID=A0ABV5XB80_9NOCA|nr:MULTISPECIES: hypothetical protein [unclassified Rhodococcus (in: high G+C Gram-positive bacteria)]AZI65754.1 hypothetical protein EHW12_32135 [Rhodococcus sp. NJ-530]KZF13440.1 hypothetical protein A2J01_34700 [Rhodococcus sp. EPR-134]MBW0285728.1 hypothetical protein [Rhodococcus sp. FH8]